MPRTAIENALMPRIEAISEALACVPDSKLWRFKGQDRHVRVAKFTDGGQTIDYRMTDDKYASVCVDAYPPARWLGWRPEGYGHTDRAGEDG